MSGLGDRIAAALGSADLGDLDRQLAEVQARAGSGRAAARMVGVGDGTWRRWRAAAGLPGGGAGGKPAKPSPGNLAKLAAAVVDVRIKDRAGRVDGMTIKATMSTRNHRDNGRIRTLDARNLRLSPGAGERVAAAYFTGGAEAAAAAYVASVGETEFYRPWLANGLIKDWSRSGYDPRIDDYEDMYDYADDIDDEEYRLDV